MSLSGKGENFVTLRPVHVFAQRSQELLEASKGCLSLNRFAPTYQQHFGKPCKASEYGYTRIAEVISSIPHVAKLIGKGAEKMVILNRAGKVLLREGKY